MCFQLAIATGGLGRCRKTSEELSFLRRRVNISSAVTGPLLVTSSQFSDDFVPTRRLYRVEI